MTLSYFMLVTELKRHPQTRAARPTITVRLKIFCVKQNNFNFLGNFFLPINLGFSAQLYRFIIEMINCAFQMLQSPLIFGHQRNVKDFMQHGEQVMIDQVSKKIGRVQG